MTFNKLIDRETSHATKWEIMEKRYGVSRDGGLPMWIADSDYGTAPCVRDAVIRSAQDGDYGYRPIYQSYLDAVQWWMRTRHNWEIDTDWILTTQGLGNAIALSIQAFTEPGDAIAIFSPVYHEFANKINKNARVVTECPLALIDGKYELDLDDAQSRLTGKEKMLIWCSPQNPSGRIWTTEELRAVAEFALRNDLILLTDEIHHDLTFAGETFVPFHVAAPEIEDRMIIVTAPSKTFNIAGQRTGNMIIPNAKMRTAIANMQNRMDYYPAMLGVSMIEAAYSQDGADWTDAQMVHLAEICALFDKGVEAIPGVRSHKLQSTYLGWVDFSATGMDQAEIEERVYGRAKIAAASGSTFGTGHDKFMRFTLATPRATIEEAVNRLQNAFSDLQ